MELIYSKSWAGMAPKEFSVSSFLQVYLRYEAKRFDDVVCSHKSDVFHDMFCLVVIKSHIHLNLVQKLPVRNPQ